MPRSLPGLPTSTNSTCPKTGVTEIYLHPAADTPELRALTPDWANRVDDHHIVVHDAGFKALLQRSGAIPIGFRALRELMRAG